jgi:isopropylmalate/homocitrate/citramalate synthase
MSGKMAGPECKVKLERWKAVLTTPMEQNYVFNNDDNNIHKAIQSFKVKRDGETNPKIKTEFSRVFALLEYAKKMGADYVEMTHISKSLKVELGFKKIEDMSEFDKNFCYEMMESKFSKN